MLFVDAAIALLVAILFTWLLVAVLGWRWPTAGERPAVWLLVLLLFPLVWIGGVWLAPIGPAVWGAFWLSFVLVGFFLALALLAVSPPRRRPQVEPTPEEKAMARAETAARVDLFFWALLVAAVAALVLSYA